MLKRKAVFSKPILPFLAILLTLNAYALHPQQWNLPEGAKTRLAKGWIFGNVAYSPDGALLAVATSIGVWLYDAISGAELSLLTGHTGWVSSVAFSPDGLTLAGGVGMKRFIYGMPAPGNTNTPSTMGTGSRL